MADTTMEASIFHENGYNNDCHETRRIQATLAQASQLTEPGKRHQLNTACCVEQYNQQAQEPLLLASYSAPNIGAVMQFCAGVDC